MRTRTRTHRWRLAYVVGGSEGIGLAVASALARQGTSVVVLSRSAEKLDTARAALEAAAAEGASVDTTAVDITDAAATKAAIDATVARTGVPDLVVVTAGFARAEWFAESDLDNLDAMMATNYFGTVHVCHALVPHLQAAGTGTIVTTSSMAGLTGVFGYAGYSASKFAVLGFSEALRRELKPAGIHVATLCPPNTRTPGFAEENRTKPAEVLAAEEKVRTLEPEQVAAHLLAVLPRRPRVIIPGRDSRWAHRAVRWLPGVVDRSLSRG